MDRTPEYPIESTLQAIELAYEWDLKFHTKRMIMNVLQSFGMPIPRPENCSLKETLHLLYKKHDQGEIVLGKNGDLQRGSNNIINDGYTSIGAIFAGNVRMNLSENKTGLVGPGSFLKDCDIMDSMLHGNIIEGGDYTKIAYSEIDMGTVFFGGAKIRQSTIGESNEIGRIEIVRSTTGKLLKALHRGFLGDAVLGDNINVSNMASITNSTPGGKKAITKIGNNVFLGGKSVIVSGENGLHIGNGAIIGAGAVVLCDVPDDHTYINRHKIYPNKK